MRPHFYPHMTVYALFCSFSAIASPAGAASNPAVSGPVAAADSPVPETGVTSLGFGTELHAKNDLLLQGVHAIAAQGAGMNMMINQMPQEVFDCEFRGNNASDRGAGLMLKKNPFTVTIRHTWMEGNIAKYGAGIYAHSPVVMENSVVIDNTATTGGGGIYAREFGGTLSNLVLDGNSSPSGAGLKFDAWAGTARNLSITSNLDGKGVHAVGVLPVSFKYNDVWNNLGGNYNTTMGDRTGIDGNIKVDPLYVSLTDFHLLGGSPLINAGDPTLLDANGTVSDIGAYGGPQGSGW